jgi:hypothetical protein
MIYDQYGKPIPVHNDSHYMNRIYDRMIEESFKTRLAFDWSGSKIKLPAGVKDTRKKRPIKFRRHDRLTK